MRPEDGTISIVLNNGEKILADRHTRKLFAYVPQGNLLLSGTIRESIAFVNSSATDEDYIYLLIHLTKHYTGGGTGIRSFMDIRLYHRRYESEMDWNYIRTVLEKIKLREFAENILGLCEVWFGNAQSNELYAEMTEYIFSSGAYGTRKHALISSMGIRAGKKNLPSKHIYWLKLFCPPLDTLEISCPFLDKLPFLVPVCWALRGVKCLLFKRRHMFQMINNVHSFSKEEAVGLRNLHEKAGLLK